MRNDELKHHGVHGQKWGVKNGPPYPIVKGGKNSAKSKMHPQKKEKNEESKSLKSRAHSMTDAQLRDAVSRMQLERQYIQLVSELNPQKKSRAKAFVADVVEKSGKKVAVELSTYVMGSTINKLTRNMTGGVDVINLGKGKDKKDK